MSTERPQSASAADVPPGPITSMTDPRAIQLLSTEHWSLLTARSLAYNEAFARAGMFLSFLSMSFVGLALLAGAMDFGQQLLTLTMIVLGFDLIVGLTTFDRISGANFDDVRAMHGMARIRHGYVQAAPMLLPYFSTATHDDVEAVLRDYDVPDGWLGNFTYAVSTSLGMVGLIVTMVAGVEIGVVGILVGLEVTAAAWLAVIGAVVFFVLLFAWIALRIPRNQARLSARFPSEPPREETQG